MPRRQGKGHTTPLLKPRKDFGSKPAIRKIQVTTQEPSESEKSPDEQPLPAEEEGEEERLMKLVSSKQDYHLRRTHGLLLQVWKRRTLCERLPGK